MITKELLMARISTPDGYSEFYSIADEQDAIKKSIDLKAHFFQMVIMDGTFEATPYGERLVSWVPGDPAPLCYIGVDKVYTPRELAIELDQVIATPDMQDKNNQFQRSRLEGLRDVYQVCAAALDKNPTLPMTFILNPVFRKAVSSDGRDYILVRDNEKVFDTQGRQIWPVMTNTPAVVPTL